MLKDLRRFVNELCRFAEDMLCYRLLLSADLDDLEQVNVKQLVDDMNETPAGYLFVSNPRNSLSRRRERMMKRPAASSMADSLLKVGGGSVDVELDA